jgi:hypothetical protein
MERTRTWAEEVARQRKDKLSRREVDAYDEGQCKL